MVVFFCNRFFRLIIIKIFRFFIKVFIVVFLIGFRFGITLFSLRFFIKIFIILILFFLFFLLYIIAFIPYSLISVSSLIKLISISFIHWIRKWMTLSKFDWGVYIFHVDKLSSAGMISCSIYNCPIHFQTNLNRQDCNIFWLISIIELKQNIWIYLNYIKLFIVKIVINLMGLIFVKFNFGLFKLWCIQSIKYLLFLYWPKQIFKIDKTKIFRNFKSAMINYW